MPLRSTRAARPLATILAGSVLMPMVAFGATGCGNSGGGGGGASAGPGSSPSNPQVATNNAPAPGSGAPMMSGAANPAMQPQQHAGMSTRQKVVILAGVALLYYLYHKHQEAKQTAANASPQLYQSQNGGIYYRNAQHQPVWVTAPSGGVAVPQDQVNQYLPNYQQYQNQPTPPAPNGYQTQSATQYDPSLQAAQ